MADQEHLSDAEIFAEFELYGEKITLPIKAHKRPILIKKLNHLRAREKLSASGRRQTPKKTTRSNSRPTSRNSETTDRDAVHSPNPDSRSRLPSRTRSPPSSKISQSSHMRSRAGATNAENFSSDDSDVEALPEVSGRRSRGSLQTNYMNLAPPTSNSEPDINHIDLGANNSPSKRRSFQLTDNVLRTMRRRTGEAPTRRKQNNEVFELSTETEKSMSSPDDEIPVLSPARTRLYPDISKFTSFMQKSNDFNFESSDSDADASTYEVDSKSVNTSFPFQSHRPSNNLDTSRSSQEISTSFEESSIRSRSLSSRRLNHSQNGPRVSHRVQPYKSRFTEHLPFFLITIAVMFFIILSMTYIVIHKDFFFSWFTTSSNIGQGDKLLLCKDGVSPGNDCYDKGEIERSLTFIGDTFKSLSSRKGQVLCDLAPSGSDVQSVTVLKDDIYQASVATTNAERLFECCINHILANPHWQIRALRKDGSVATTVAEVVQLESEVAAMGFWCRLSRSFTHVLYILFACVLGFFAVVFVSSYVKYKMRQKEKEQREVYAMVEKIIDILQEHYEQTKGEDSDEPPYLAVRHVRDQLLPPSQRHQLQPVWNQAVEFIAANESRIRLETRFIRGDEFEVWHWLQPSLHNGKVWQGQAFGESSDGHSGQVLYSPTPCLKVRNMFDSNVEVEDNWEANVTDAILEKCKNIEHVVHVYVDVDSKEGCVYLKCSSCEAAGKARLALNGWWFDGRLVTAKHLKTDHYHKRWPEARTAFKAMKPTTDQMRSLSQPFYRSSLEMT